MSARARQSRRASDRRLLENLAALRKSLGRHGKPCLPKPTEDLDPQALNNRLSNSISKPRMSNSRPFWLGSFGLLEFAGRYRPTTFFQCPKRGLDPPLLLRG